MRAYFCKENDILVIAKNKREAVEYAVDRLGPEYGHEPGRADNLNLQPISMDRARDICDDVICWDIHGHIY